jgi:hypothetical protein
MSKINNRLRYSHQIAFIIFLFIFVFNNAKAQDSTNVLQRNALTTLRNFVNQLNKTQQTPQRDNLLITATKLIQTTKTIKDTSQLRNIIVYFNHAGNSLATVDEKNILLVQRFINADLQLKLTGKRDKSLSFSAWEKMFENRDVGITAYINGVKQSTGVFTVYWFGFDGSNREALIRNNVFTKCSLKFDNPYLLDVLLPGYITFWMKNNATNQKYKSDQDYYILKKTDSNIDVNFILVH